jgi:type IV secretion system protein TrbL
MCGITEVECKLGNAFEGLVTDALENLAKSIMEGLSQMVTTLSTFWVETPTVNLAGSEGGSSPVVSTVNDELMVWTMSLAVLAVIIGGTRMIWEQRGAPLKDLLRSLITLTLVTGLGVGVISILVIAADTFSVAIINKSTDGKGFAESMKLLTTMGQTGVAVFILIILGLIGLIASIFQIVLMVVRSGMLVILAGILPTTAAFTNTEMGKQWFQKAIGWTIAFILYKPAAAIVYSVAFLLMSGDGGGGIIASITGFTLMIVALFALPALMRFVTPMVGAMASGAGGGAAGAAVGAMATGAVSMGRMGSGKGNAAPTPSSSKSTNSASTPQGSNGAQGGGSQPIPGSAVAGGPAGPTGTGATGTAGAGAAARTSGAAGSAGAAAGGTSGAGAGAAASGAAAGPAGITVGAAIQTASRTSQAIQQTAQDSTGEGPSGSN